MIIPLTNQNASEISYAVLWQNNTAAITHNLNTSDVIVQAYDNNGKLFYLDATIIDNNNISINLIQRPSLGATYQIIIKDVVSFSLTDSNGSSNNIASNWNGNEVLITHNITGDIIVQLWDEENKLVNLPIFKISDYSFKIDFSNATKPTSLNPWKITLKGGFSASVSNTNGNKGDISWIWTVNKLTIFHSYEMYPFFQIYSLDNELIGIDAINQMQGALDIYFLDGYKPQSGQNYLIIIADAEQQPIFTETQYYASGKYQLNHNTGEVIMRLVPAQKQYGQYFMIDEQPNILGNGILYQFQISSNPSFNSTIRDITQDSMIVSNDPTYQHSEEVNNNGNVFFMNPSFPRIGVYYWRMRYSQKQLDGSGEYIWYDWSRKFPVVVNKPAVAPDGLKITAIQ